MERERETRPRLAGRTKERKKAVIKRRDFYAQTKTTRTTHRARPEHAQRRKERNACNESDFSFPHAVELQFGCINDDEKGSTFGQEPPLFATSN